MTQELPAWFHVGADIQFHGVGNSEQVMTINEKEGWWVGYDGLNQRRYPLKEIRKHWGPVKLS